jgi:hypothetical protein
VVQIGELPHERALADTGTAHDGHAHWGILTRERGGHSRQSVVDSPHTAHFRVTCADTASQRPPRRAQTSV